MSTPTTHTGGTSEIEIATPGSSPSPIPDLTSRELDVLCGVSQGLSNQDIAGELGIEKSTVRSHISTILHKLELANRTQAALYAIEVGLGRPREKL